MNAYDVAGAGNVGWNPRMNMEQPSSFRSYTGHNPEYRPLNASKLAYKPPSGSSPPQGPTTSPPPRPTTSSTETQFLASMTSSTETQILASLAEKFRKLAKSVPPEAVFSVPPETVSIENPSRPQLKRKPAFRNLPSETASLANANRPPENQTHLTSLAPANFIPLISSGTTPQQEKLTREFMANSILEATKLSKDKTESAIDTFVRDCVKEHLADYLEGKITADKPRPAITHAIFERLQAKFPESSFNKEEVEKKIIQAYVDVAARGFCMREEFREVNKVSGEVRRNIPTGESRDPKTMESVAIFIKELKRAMKIDCEGVDTSDADIEKLGLSALKDFESAYYENFVERDFMEEMDKDQRRYHKRYELDVQITANPNNLFLK